MVLLSIERVIEVVTAHGYKAIGGDVVEPYGYITESGAVGKGERLKPLATLREDKALKSWLRAC